MPIPLLSFAGISSCCSKRCLSRTEKTPSWPTPANALRWMASSPRPLSKTMPAIELAAGRREGRRKWTQTWSQSSGRRAPPCVGPSLRRRAAFGLANVEGRRRAGSPCEARCKVSSSPW
ncbi:hypothetical protein BOTBODRAFT_541154 [Botryobasidium botryosum FD-172 SS1]|uniref:Uncharacterized protein n=1 Tax=Botryobasidium botryosum (strain FD-172 SS1) TaxID=930990 RepID=A0A067LZU3_BOTB1|nr:hypothetical protein BOTBODRAFT_541154 [Botryobasidium botryosum FD-172 SS1]